jgi:hypothetical protein
MAEHFWKSVLEAKTFNSSAGRILQAEAKKKLAAIDAMLDLDLLAKVYAFYLEEAPYDLWPATKKTRDEHAATLVKALRSSKAIQAHLLVAAHDQGGADGVRMAGDFLATIAKNSHVPGMLKSMGKNWSKLDHRRLGAAAASALEKHSKDPQLSDIIPFYALVYVVARALPDAPVLAAMKAADEREPDEHRTFARTVAAAAKA